MKKIINPWRGLEGYRCFGCDPNSPQGLRMEFYEEGDEVVCRWRPRPEFQGWVDTLHGGIQATLADEISSWVVFRKFQTSGVTSKMQGQLCTEAACVYFLFPKEKAHRDFHFCECGVEETGECQAEASAPSVSSAPVR